MIQFLSILLVLFVAMPAWAFHPEDGIDANFALTHFDFTEFDDMQMPTVSEKGWIYGGELEGRKSFGRLYLQMNASLHQGTVTYNGQTQLSELPHQTDTVETLADYSFSIGRSYESWRRYDYGFIYGGLGIHQWVRDIKQQGNIIGLYEVYRWMYAHVGARGYLFHMGPVHFFLEMSLLRTLFPRMTLDSYGVYPDVEIPLGEHYGAKFVLPIRIHVGRRFQMNIEPFFETWDLGRSEHIDITTSDNIAVGSGVHEPRSASRFYGVNIGFTMRFD